MATYNEENGITVVVPVKQELDLVQRIEQVSERKLLVIKHILMTICKIIFVPSMMMILLVIWPGSIPAFPILLGYAVFSLISFILMAGDMQVATIRAEYKKYNSAFNWMVFWGIQVISSIFTVPL